MMCLESDGSSGSSPGCGGRLRGGDEEEEEDGERGCCGRGAEGEVQTLSGRMNPPAAGKRPERPAARHKAPSLGRARVAAAGILSVGNVLNYLDRYTVAGVLLDIQQHFGVKDSGAGLLQTVFICSFMVAAPIFGYLGDRFNRKIILSCGIFFWSAVTFSSSFITEQDSSEEQNTGSSLNVFPFFLLRQYMCLSGRKTRAEIRKTLCWHK